MPPIYLDDPAAIPLVEVCDKTGDVSLNENAVAIIKAIQSPFSVMTVCGLYRTGKSYLLNNIVLSGEGKFPVGNTTRACTRGLLMWNRPIEVEDEITGETIRALIIDTEGLAATTANVNQDSKIFCMALLFSTIFVYNSVGTIDESAINNLHLITKLASSVQGKDGSIAQKLDFMWVVRDFSLQPVNDSGAPIPPSEYLENALKTTKQSRAKNSRSNKQNDIRKSLKTVFPKRDCVTLVRPCVQESDLQQLQNLPQSCLRDEFVCQIQTLREKLFTGIVNTPFLSNGRPVSGEGFIDLVKFYVKSINEGKLPAVREATEYLCREQAQALLDTSLKEWEEFDREMREEENIHPVTSRIRTRLWLSKKMKIFDENPLIEKETAQSFKLKFQEELEGKSSRSLEQIQKNFQRKVTEILTEYADRFKNSEAKSSEALSEVYNIAFFEFKKRIAMFLPHALEEEEERNVSIYHEATICKWFTDEECGVTFDKVVGKVVKLFSSMEKKFQEKEAIYNKQTSKIQEYANALSKLKSDTDELITCHEQELKAVKSQIVFNENGEKEENDQQNNDSKTPSCAEFENMVKEMEHANREICLSKENLKRKDKQFIEIEDRYERLKQESGKDLDLLRNKVKENVETLKKNNTDQVASLRKDVDSYKRKYEEAECAISCEKTKVRASEAAFEISVKRAKVDMLENFTKYKEENEIKISLMEEENKRRETEHVSKNIDMEKKISMHRSKHTCAEHRIKELDTENKKLKCKIDILLPDGSDFERRMEMVRLETKLDLVTKERGVWQERCDHLESEVKILREEAFTKEREIYETELRVRAETYVPV